MVFGFASSVSHWMTQALRDKALPLFVEVDLDLELPLEKRRSYLCEATHHARFSTKKPGLDT